MIRLHDYPRSSAAYRVRIALNLKQLEYESVIANLLTGAQRSDAYAALNPQRLVPTLEIDGLVLGQSLAIIEYLDERYPHPPLLPRDPAARAEVRAMALAVACDIHPLNNLRVLTYLRTALVATEDGVDTWYRHWIAEGLQALESLARRHSSDGRHMHGAVLTLADVCLVPQLFNARRFGCPLEDYPTLAGIDAQLQALPAFAAAHPGRPVDA